ncbi:HD family hydrolase [Asticcacaulis sp.]|uniref:HD domain-containing protein n=1 Tax=Asticcacaulis sp. TaxID=1872648 RepID=UPI002618D9E6|nr:HD family hydrolase [Asticcacaulis sp.]
MSKPPPVPTHLDAPRTNLLMRSGRWVNLYDPSPADIMLEDWVTGASRVARWGGQTRGDTAYNVLQHSVLLEQVLVTLLAPDASPALRLAALMHDLHEGGGLGDVVTPYGKLFATAGLKEVKARLDRALFLSVGLPWPLPAPQTDLIKKADKVTAISEAIQLMGWPEKLARRDIGGNYRGKLWTQPIMVVGEAEARGLWWDRYRVVTGATSP